MKKLIFLLALFLTQIFANSTIEITKTVNKLTSIAVENSTDNKEYEKLSLDFYQILVNDLTILTHFDVKNSNQKSTYTKDSSAFANRNMDYVLKFKLYKDKNGNLSCENKVINVVSNSVKFIKTYKIADDELYPFLAHQIISDVNNYFGMAEVDWLTKYIIFSRYTKPRHSEIVIADYTLTYVKTLVGSGLNLFPKWADETQKAFYFTRYERSMPTLYKMNIVTGSLDRILQTEGMLACSDVSQDGKKILLTMAPYGQPDIYLYNTETKTKKALTKYSGIDVSAHFIENDKRFTFVSNRLGFPTIFAKEIEGKKRAIEQLVYYGKNNNSCTSHNNYIIYSSRETDNSFSQNTFNLHLISTDTNYVRRLTATGINQFPQFSSDGESVLFIKHFKKQSSLGIIRLNYNKNFLFPLNVGKIQSIDW